MFGYFHAIHTSDLTVNADFVILLLRGNPSMLLENKDEIHIRIMKRRCRKARLNTHAH